MCGIVGIITPYKADPLKLTGMLSSIEHRGPDEGYLWNDDYHVALGVQRLSIVNLQNGVQPTFSEEGSICAILNGEIYNYQEIKIELTKYGFNFREGSDAEVIPAAYQYWGIDFASHFNGDFAIVVWDKLRQETILVRDRTGQKPLFYTKSQKGDFLFASEIKALFEDDHVVKELNPVSIAQVFTFWTFVDSHTTFKNIYQVPLGTALKFSLHGDCIKKHVYWDIPYSKGQYSFVNSFHECQMAFKEELKKAVKIRLKADVKVGTYISGGVDSSVINYIVSKELNHKSTEAFSIGFENKIFDESTYQKKLSEHLGINLNEITCSNQDIYENFSNVVYHCEAPLFRTAPVPMYILSKNVQDNNFKVVLTGEGSDEVNWGYDIFRETKIRNFWSKDPSSKLRPQLFRKLYNYLPQFQNTRYLNLTLDFFKRGISDINDPLYSHALRILNSNALIMYFDPEIKKQIENISPIELLKSNLPVDYNNRTILEKCQYLEMKTLLSGYLLSSQGDRMQSAHGIEGRYPYLDHNFIEFAATIPEKYKLNGIADKFILRQTYANFLPNELINRPKFAYRAPEMEAFVEDKHGMVRDVLSKESIENLGIFDSKVVQTLLARLFSDQPKKFSTFSTRDNLAFIQILSTQLLFHLFIVKPKQNKKYFSNKFKMVSFKNKKVHTASCTLDSY
ncbi:MAG: asparagine synthase (glutamine-hydrolyzing) [Oligoflexia bacterium]|nr:asparagine synthase (glutamine-hydrolyzing) [Oligoflexia bacterium]